MTEEKKPKGIICNGCGKEVSQVSIHISAFAVQMLCIPCYRAIKLGEKKE